MKTYVTRILATLSLGVALGPASLLAQSSLHANIPFSFTAGNNTFGAGEYLLQPVLGQCLRLQGVDQPASATIIMANAGWVAPKLEARSRLTFNRYGDRYFLSRVAGPARTWELRPSPAEKELIAKQGSPRPVVVASSQSR